MAEPEDPKPETPPPLDDFDDDLVGFASPRALQGTRPQRPAPVPEPEAEPSFPEAAAPVARMAAGSEPTPDRDATDSEPEIFASPVEPDPEPVSEPPAPEPEPSQPEPVVAQPVADPEPEQEPEVVAEPEPPAPEPDPEPLAADPTSDPEIIAASPRPEPAPAPVSREDVYGRPGATRRFERPPSRGEPGLASEGDARLTMVIYAFLVAAAFSAGATALIALLLAWTARFWVKGWTRSHLLYQIRTSFIGVIASIAGVLTLPLGLGVFILSLTVIWIVARAAAGLIRLMRREEVRNPQTWSLA